jgi:hypothetical protein
MSIRSTAEQALAGARFFLRVPFFLRRPVQLAEARAMLRDGLARRADRLVDRIRRDVFGRPGSVYHRLFRQAGIEIGDVERLVASDGPEDALRKLFQAGIYLSVDEFKGRVPIRRGSLRLEARPEELRSPRAAYHLPASSGGSRSAGTPVLIDLAFVRACAANWLVCMDVWGGLGWKVVDWETPGAGARFRLLKFACAGRTPVAWFSPVNPDDPSLPPIVRWSTDVLRAAAALSARPMPAPHFAPASDPLPVARSLRDQLRRGATPLLFGFPGPAVRLALAAGKRGVDIAGARFQLTGEPITAARRATIERQGGAVIPRFGTVECGAIGYGCPNGDAPDEVHLLQNMHVIIQAGDNDAALPPEALLITNLHPQSPFLMLNVSMGDQARLRRRDCGCPWSRLGLDITLAEIRSFEKLTGAGVTFLGTDVVRILEETLPARFGGAPTDYQLVEGEGPAGEPLLWLVVHPEVGPLEEPEVVEFFLGELARLAPHAGMMAQRWRDARVVRLQRRAPAVSQAGKILHLHTLRRPEPSPTSH